MYPCSLDNCREGALTKMSYLNFDMITLRPFAIFKLWSQLFSSLDSTDNLCKYFSPIKTFDKKPVICKYSNFCVYLFSNDWLNLCSIYLFSKADFRSCSMSRSVKIKQIFQPKHLPKTEPSNLFSILISSQDRKTNSSVCFWKKFWLEFLLSKFTDL